MKKRPLLLFVLLGCFLLAGIALYSQRERLYLRQVDRILQRVDASLLTDGQLHVVLCGTAAALPDRDRAGPCTAILANGEFLLVDAGPGSWRNVDLANLPIGKLSGILVTHFHSDHIAELGEATVQSWIGGRSQPLPIYGPEGIEDIVAGFNQVYRRDVGYRVAHHDPAYMPPQGGVSVAQPFSAPQPGTAVTVLERNGLKVTAFRVSHRPIEPAVGYRIEYGGRSVVISGDTTAVPETVRMAQGADLLIHEALATQLTRRAAARAKALGMGRTSKLATDVGDYHTTPVEAAQLAQQASVKTLVLSHIFPPLPNPIARRLFLAGTADAFQGKIILGEDGQRFDFAPRQP